MGSTRMLTGIWAYVGHRWGTVRETNRVREAQIKIIGRGFHEKHDAARMH